MVTYTDNSDSWYEDYGVSREKFDEGKDTNEHSRKDFDEAEDTNEHFREEFDETEDTNEHLRKNVCMITYGPLILCRPPLTLRNIWDSDEIQLSLQQLPNATNVLNLLETEKFEDILTLAAKGDDYIRTTVLWASWLGKSSLLAKLLDIGVDSNYADGGGRTCLHLACFAGNEDCVKLLLDHNADPNRWDSTSEGKATPLHCAVNAKSVSCVKMLLSHEADVNAGLKEYSPLYYAVRHDSPEVVSVLLDAGACTNAPMTLLPFEPENNSNIYGHLPFQEAPTPAPRNRFGYSRFFASIIRAFAQRTRRSQYQDDSPSTVDAEIPPEDDFSTAKISVPTESPLHVAAYLGSVKCMKLLLDAGADVQAILAGNGYTPLHLAVFSQNSECICLLLDHGARINATDSNGASCLHLAASIPCIPVLKLLIARQANVQLQNFDGQTPLHIAITERHSHVQATRVLLSAGADPNAQDNFGYTPFVVAIVRKCYACVQLFLDNGGDICLKSSREGVSALSQLILNMPDIIPQYVAKFDNLIFLHLQMGDVEDRLGIDLQPLVHPSRGETALITEFVEVGQTDILKHPVVEAFLFVKWKLIKKFFILSFLYHAIFTTAYTVYILHTFLCEEVTCDVPAYLIPVQYALIVLNICFLTKEIYQARLGYLAYIRQWENWVQLFLISGGFLCTIPPWYLNGGAMKTFKWQHDVAAITIFICWFKFMMIVGRLPKFGLYIQMFTTVSVNFASFLLAYSCLLLAFALAFSVVFSNYPVFHLPVGLIKTVMMMTGELEFEDTLYTDTPLQYPFTAHGMFFIFALLVTMILTNLLIGLAVSDIQALREGARLDRLVRQTQLIAHLESVLFSSSLNWVPQKILAFLRKGSLLKESNMCTLFDIGPNDPQQRLLPKELVASIYKVVNSRRNQDERIMKQEKCMINIEKQLHDLSNEINKFTQAALKSRRRKLQARRTHHKGARVLQRLKMDLNT